jgi:hypothetical protein
MFEPFYEDLHLLEMHLSDTAQLEQEPLRWSMVGPAFVIRVRVEGLGLCFCG